ncbi:MAG: hypothetical protein GWN62_15530 [Aliifodinibius sp.]|nr:hypothetical protein [candidate division KSB1 bacterium]NIV12633.1 hypothetical protein [Fodinibius sp.]NIR71625.1 hypothetical protein [candidate division KSB1 bacterium]NIS24853.1 hypothetical protein [candidate division KSB1 bacterium]NIU25493.1 hypothetical protein [candidate division KSB1 bacterium]
MLSRFIISIVAVPILFVGCGADRSPVGIGEEEPEHDDELTAELTLSADHVHTLSEVIFTVVVKDHHGSVVTDFESIQVERKLVGTDTWRGIELALEGSSYKGAYTFTTSGEYHLRVSGMRPGEHEMAMLYEPTESYHVGRAHLEAGGYRVEFENFPGHIHEGDTATMKFWVKSLEKDASGNRPPITGLSAEIHCGEANGTNETHTAVEAEPGVYQAEHTFQSAGEAHMGIEYMGTGGSMAESEFYIHISHGH